LAVVFAAEKFHTYIYGAKVIVDKPLETIQLKQLAQAPPKTSENDAPPSII